MSRLLIAGISREKFAITVLSIGDHGELDIEGGHHGGVTLDGVTVDNDGTIQVDFPNQPTTLTLQDGTTIDGGRLSIGYHGELDIEGGHHGGATLEGVTVDNDGTIQVDFPSQSTMLTLEDGTTIEGGTLKVGSSGVIDSSAGHNAIEHTDIFNNGIIESTGGKLTVDGGTITNTGLLAADDGGALVRVDGVIADEAGGLTAVPKHAPLGPQPDIQAECVAGTRAVLQQDLSLELPIGRWLHQALIDDGEVPARQVLRGHCQFAGCKEPTLAHVRRRTQRAQGRPRVAHRVGSVRGSLVGIHDARHVQGSKYAALQRSEQWLAGYLLEDHASGGVARIAVLPTLARREIERLTGPELQDLRGRDRR